MIAPGVLEQSNVGLVGYHDLDKKPGFKMGLQKVGSQWFLYMGHLWHRGWSVLDVSNPSEPKLVNFTNGPLYTWTIQMQVADGKMITALEKPNSGWGIHDGMPYQEGAFIWDIASDPIHPRLLGQYKTGGTGTHRNFYAGGKYAYMTANPAGYLGHVLVIVDISDPAKPHEVSKWHLPEQKTATGGGPSILYFHGPADVVGNRAYLSYGRTGILIIDVSDASSPRLVSRVSLGDFGSILGCHSAVKVPGRDLLIANSEAIFEGTGDALNYTLVVDISKETEPKIISSFPLPVPRSGLPYRSYYEKGGRFGPHNQHHYQGQTQLWSPINRIPMTYFNAGLRIFDIGDPFVPRELGYFVPEDPRERMGVLPTRLTAQFEDVLVDSRGYIYCTDKNFGLFVLESSDGL